MYRLKPQAERELDGLKSRLKFLVKVRAISADSALDAYLEACRQVSCNRFAFEEDDREWSPVKCRACGRTSSVVLGASKYSCRCSPTVAREAFLDMVGRDGSYLLVDPIAAKPKDKMAERKQALLDGATLAEADALIQ